MTGSKLRPAVVVQGEFLNGLIDDTILVQITTTRHGIPGTEVVLDPVVETGSKSEPGLCGFLHQRYDLRSSSGDSHDRLLTDAAMRQIEASLKTVLEFP